MAEITKISVFDLDETIVRMPSYTASKQVEAFTSGQSKFPTPYSFYDNPLSMDRTIHNIQFISPVIDDWRLSVHDASSRTILITHRTEELRPHVERVLSPAGLELDAMYCLGRATEKFDTLVKELEERPLINEISIYEDTLEQIIKYKTGFDTLSKFYHVKFYFVDKSKVYRLYDFEAGEKRRIELI
jgi:cell fate (sporulation/competence/biofilm development) regulator YmcA (YheA/YmcA/DUF963 family)